MTGDRRIRLIVAAVVVVALALFAGALLTVADTVLSILQRLREGPALVYWAFLALLAAAGAAAVWLLWWLLAPGRSAPKRGERPHGEAGIRERLEEERAAGGDVSAVERELTELARRREGGVLYLALFGEASSGKSSIVRALVPGAEPDVAVTGGTTRSVTQYRWQLASGDAVELADVPGAGDEAALRETALEEALRAHLVIYVCEGDLTRTQYEDVETLAALGKPLVVAVNKADWYDEASLAQITTRLGERLAGLGSPPAVVPISAGGTELVVRAEPSGRERRLERPRKPQVDALRAALQAKLDDEPAALDALRDAAVFRLATVRLERAADERRRREADAVVAEYTKKAVIGALAAITPGTDILIQGYLGSALVKTLCRLYDAPVRDLDIQRFLDIAQGYVGRVVPLVLAISGNVLKAFPGVGTVAGGLVHAVAYGLIFDALGKGLAESLETTGELRPAAAARKVGDQLGDDIGKRARGLARLALEARREQRRKP